MGAGRNALLGLKQKGRKVEGEKKELGGGGFKPKTCGVRLPVLNDLPIALPKYRPSGKNIRGERTYKKLRREARIMKAE